MITLKKPLEFEWDEGNIDKNIKHKVANKEAEEIFFDRKKVIYKDTFHSKGEERLIILGKTQRGRLLYTIFTLRNTKVRIISTRDINKKEVKLYEKSS